MPARRERNRPDCLQPEPTPLGFAILSLLARRSRTGYELSRFTAPPRSMLLLTAGHSNVYKELGKLAKLGYVSFRTLKDPRPLDKKLYSLTGAGRERLREWTAQKPQRRWLRRDLSIKAHAAWLADPEQVVDLFTEQAVLIEEEITELIRHAEEVYREGRLEPPPAATDPLFGVYSLTRLEVERRKVLAEWCRWMAEAISSSSQSDAPQAQNHGQRS